MNQKIIFITGGVCSSLGKGITSASIGTILKNSGYSVFTQKLDPYLNIDPGTMSPFQHGEVFVTDDGAETDLDLGHYERFIDSPLSKRSTVTNGKIYQKVLEKERKGDFAGSTIQVVPHITNEIKKNILLAQKESQADFLIVEIGGTVGDIEGEPFLEAVRQLRQEKGKEEILFIHLTLLPYLQGAKELKTKPTQLSVRELRRMGLNPDIILARADKKIPNELLEKISHLCGIEEKAVIPVVTLDSIYKVPIYLEKSNLSSIIQEKLKLKIKEANLVSWEVLNKKINKIKDEIKIGLAGKYTGLDDAYLSVIEAIKTSALFCNKKAKIIWIDTEKLENNDYEEQKKLEEVKGVIVPGGFGVRGVEGKIQVAKYARENNLPYLGLCLGSQILVIEFARNVAGIITANSEEFDLKAKHKLIHFLPNQNEEKNLGGTLRLGSYPCLLKEKTIAYKSYKLNKSKTIYERHRHRYEFNNEYKEILEKKGLIVSGVYPEKNLMEIVEIKNHCFMLGTQFHPEFLSRPTKPHPLFLTFMETILKC
jgi:CTP synthase